MAIVENGKSASGISRPKLFLRALIRLARGQTLNFLEEKVKERTTELQAANKELEAFSYSISHDLQAPLRLIDGYARILLEDHGASIDEEGHRLAGIISRNALRMGRLIDDLLEFSKLSRTEIHKSLINTNEMVKTTFLELLENSEGHKVKFTISELPPVKGDHALILQVLGEPDLERYQVFFQKGATGDRGWLCG